MFKRISLFTSLAVICLTLTACSTKVAYNYLDWGMMWYTQKYIDLNSEQKKRVRKDFDSFHQWHKTTQLPRYAEFLKSLKVIMLNAPTAKQLHTQTDIMQNFLDDSALFLLPTLADTASSMSDKQVAFFLKKIDKNNKKFQKKNVDINNEKRHKKRQKDLSKHLNRLIGNLTNKQKEWLVEWSKSVVDFESLMLKQQQLWREDYKTVLANRKNTQATRLAIKNIMLYRSDDWIPELKEKIDINQAMTFSLLEKILANLSPKQQRKLARTLDKYIDICEQLSQKTD